jgi:hypothetical protein
MIAVQAVNTETEHGVDIKQRRCESQSESNDMEQVRIRSTVIFGSRRGKGAKKRKRSKVD